MRYDDRFWETLRNFIEGRLPAAEAAALQQRLADCPELHTAYLELREALFTRAGGLQADSMVENEVLLLVREASGRGPVWRLIVRLANGAVSLASGMFGEEAPFLVRSSAEAWREADARPGPLTASRTVGDRLLTLALAPLADGSGCTLSIDLENPAGCTAALRLEGRIVERIDDLAKRRHFETPLENGTEAETALAVGGAPLCAICLRVEG